jgi:hypothetical protein
MAFPGSVLLSGDQYIQTSDKRHPLGTRGYTRDGRVFRYAENGAAALAAGTAVQQAVPIVNWHRQLHPSTYDYGTTIPAGSTYLYVHFRAISSGTLPTSANILADGYMFVNDGTGNGQYLQIQSNTLSTSTLAAAACRTKVVFREGEILTSKLHASSGVGGGSTDSVVGLLKNKYKDVVTSAKSATGTGVVVGVAPIAVTANYYFWLQTWGPACVLIDTAATIANRVQRSATDVGALMDGSSGAVHLNQPELGQWLATGVDTDYGLADLMIAP